MSETVLPVFTKEMKATHTILVPNMLPFHFALLRSALQSCGYKAEILQNTGRNVIETGLKYVNSDICYPALLYTFCAKAWKKQGSAMCQLSALM